jgi:hypothetical protein
VGVVHKGDPQSEGIQGIGQGSDRGRRSPDRFNHSDFIEKFAAGRGTGRMASWRVTLCTIFVPKSHFFIRKQEVSRRLNCWQVGDSTHVLAHCNTLDVIAVQTACQVRSQRIFIMAAVILLAQQNRDLANLAQNKRSDF